MNKLTPIVLFFLLFNPLILAQAKIRFSIPQTVSFGTAPSIQVGGQGTVTATASSGLPVSLISTTTGVCKVSGNTITGVAAGTCTIQASQAGDFFYNAAPSVLLSFVVVKISQTVSLGNLPSLDVGGQATVLATASSGLPVSLISSTTGVCKVSGNTITGIAAGICTIHATQAGNAKYYAAISASQSITLTAATIGQINPITASSATNISIIGKGFTPTSKVILGTQNITPTYISPTQLSFVIPFSQNQNLALVGLQAGKYSVQVDSSNKVNLTVIDLPVNPHPAGVLLASQITSIVNTLSVSIPAFQADLSNLLNDQNGNSGTQQFIRDFAQVVKLINTTPVEAELTKLTHQLDLQSLDTLERSLLVNHTSSNNATIASAALKPSISKAAATLSCPSFTTGDSWLACRGANLDAQMTSLTNKTSDYFKYCGFAASGAQAFKGGISIPIVGKVCAFLSTMYSIGSTLGHIEVTKSYGTLKGFGLNINGMNLPPDTLKTDLNELMVNLYLNNYDNNANVSLQTPNKKYLTGATLSISSKQDWVNNAASLASDIAPLVGISTKNPALDAIITYSIKLTADIVNKVVNPANFNLPVTNTNISTVSTALWGLSGACNNFLDQTSSNSTSYTGSNLTMQQNSSLQWLVFGAGPNLNPSQYSPTLEGCKYRVNDKYRLPSEDNIDTNVQFFVKRYPFATIKVVGKGSVAYSITPLSGFSACNNLQPSWPSCTEYFDIYTYSNPTFTALDANGSPASNVTWSGTGLSNVSCANNNATCVVNFDPTNNYPPVVTATIGTSQSGGGGTGGGSGTFSGTFAISNLNLTGTGVSDNGTFSGTYDPVTKNLISVTVNSSVDPSISGTYNATTPYVNGYFYADQFSITAAFDWGCYSTHLANGTPTIVAWEFDYSHYLTNIPNQTGTCTITIH